MNDRRMMMLDVASFAALRAELLRTLGPAVARGVFMRIGFISGRRDAELLKERISASDPILFGPRFHGLAGIVQVEQVSVTRDAAGGHHADYIWHHCAEDDAHISSYGIGTEPSCWMEVGYASGFVSCMTGIPHLFRELSCRSMGRDVCHVLQKPAAAWTDADEELACLGMIGGHSRGIELQPRQAPVESPEPALDRGLPEYGPSVRILGESPALRASLHALRRVAPTNASVLICGESGVGKELFARTLHQLSRRAQGPFVAVNCAAIPESLLESELFGVERGAFTGAVQRRAGRFERARGGTLFLDEIGTLNPVSQAKLLRALQECEIERVGGTQAIRTDVRIVAATNADLRSAVASGQFRDDLFFRLNVFPIKLPPLRERRDDIRLLLGEFLRRYNAAHGKAVRGFTVQASQALLHYDYPGNVRELQNLVERAVILAEADVIDVAHLFSPGEGAPMTFYGLGGDGKLSEEGASPAPAVQSQATLVQQIAGTVFANNGAAGPLRLQEFEKDLASELIHKALAQARGNVSMAARMLGMKRHQLEYRLKTGTARGPGRRARHGGPG